jgi:hypothetical protein
VLDDVPVHFHPDLLLLRHPEIAATVDRWRTGARRSISLEDYERLTFWETEAVLIMKAAHDRAEAKRLEALRDEYANRTS